MDEQWLVREFGFTRSSLVPQETVFTIGNGYLSTRGSFEEGFLGDRPATLIHGVFDDAPIVVTELANAPNWLPLAPYIDGERLQLDSGELQQYERVLNMRNGLLTRTVRWKSPTGRTVDLRFERFASLADKNLLVQRLLISPVDGPCEIELHASLKGNALNMEVEHWNKVDQGPEEGNTQTVFLESMSRGTVIRLTEAARLAVYDVEHVDYSTKQRENEPTVIARFQLAQGQTATAEKITLLLTSYDVGRDTRQPARARLEEVSQGDGPAFDRLLRSSEEAWARLWENSDIEIVGDDEAQIGTRYNIFQLLIAAPRNDPYVSIPAKTLSGFGYRGHVFWDTEIFILPLFSYTQSQTARNLLLYRYHTLGGARRKAREGGYKGAQFAWESALNGEEVTPKFVPGPSGQMVRIWTGDIEIHISSDVAYAIWQYWRASGDDDFMKEYGAEIVLDTALFWGSRVEWNAAKERYELTDVIGPDEYHEHVDNNFFTNYLVKWHLQFAFQVRDWLRQHDPAKAGELTERLGLGDDAYTRWQHVIDHIYLPRSPHSKVFEQFEGYFELRDVDLAELEPRSKSVQALLGIEDTNKTQVLKQADVLMLFYMLPEEFDQETMRANWEYYTPRTDLSYGSSLAPGIQAILACRMGDPQTAYPFYLQAVEVDLKDLRLNTEDGIHGATAGSVWQAAVFGFGGIHLRDGQVTAEPRLPEKWQRLRFKLFFRGQLREFEFTNSGS